MFPRVLPKSVVLARVDSVRFFPHLFPRKCPAKEPLMRFQVGRETFGQGAEALGGGKGARWRWDLLHAHLHLRSFRKWKSAFMSCNRKTLVAKDA